MSLFRRRKHRKGSIDVEEGGGGGYGTDTTSTTSFSNNTNINNNNDDDYDNDYMLQHKAQDVMKDNLELMRDVVMQIRSDPEFASSIYKDCPRLQHLLNQYPDLRPIFENPKLIRINFEQVYRDAGGVLPEDEEKKNQSWLLRIVNSPIFKVLKFAMMIKKLVSFITSGGFAFVSGCLLGCCCEDALDEIDEIEIDDADIDADFDPNKEALYKAADHMEDPEVQEQMQRLLEDPDHLQDAIENDKELRALRDSNPLCEELMSDPDTMRILTDPDNLRALGEAPSLIEADFMNPDTFMPDADVDVDNQMGGFDGEIDANVDGEFDNGVDADEDAGGDLEDGDIDADADGEDGEGNDGEEEEEEEGWWEDGELEEQDMDDDVDNNNQSSNNAAKDVDDNNNSSNNASKARSQARSQAQKHEEQPQEGNGFRGIMASIGVAATDIIAAQIVGSIFGDDLLPGEMGVGEGGALGGVDNGVIDDAVNNADDVLNDDVANVVTDTTQEVDGSTNTRSNGPNNLDFELDDDGKKKSDTAAAAVGATGVMVVGGTARGDIFKTDVDADEDGMNDEEEEPKKQNKFIGAIRNLGSAVATAAKEHVAGSLLGDDFGGDLVQRIEEGRANNDDEEIPGTTNETSDKSKRRGLSGRGS